MEPIAENGTVHGHEPEAVAPNTATPSITLGRAVKWYALLQRLGYPRMLDALNAPPPTPKPGPAPRSAGSESILDVFRDSFGPAERPGTVRMTFDFEHIFREIVEQGLMVEFAAIVLDLPEAEAEAADIRALTEATGPFVSACFALLREVIMPATRLN